jgi:predicted ribosomally synthesized peptide with nif11-like leader
MSSNELSRLLADARKEPRLLDELRGLLRDPEAMRRWAEERGYPLTREDMAELQDSDQELSDEELKQAAGGDTAWPPPPVPPPVDP